MKQECYSRTLNCSSEGRVEIKVGVNIGGKLQGFCSLQCADDAIQELSDGQDCLGRAILDGDVFTVPSIAARVADWKARNPAQGAYAVQEDDEPDYSGGPNEDYEQWHRDE